VATGRQIQLTGATGEFLVAAELCRRGLMATPFAGNVPHYDIVASGQHGGHRAVQVKAVTRGTWQFNVKPFMDVDFDGTRQSPRRVKGEPYPELHVVMVALADEHDPRDRFYVLRWLELRDLLAQRYRAYLQKHEGQRPRSPGSFHVSLLEGELAPFRDRWDTIFEGMR